MAQAAPISSFPLICYDLTCCLGGIQAVNHVSLTFEQNKIHAIIGPNGAGKTTLLDLLAGERYPRCGRIFLAEYDITRKPPWIRAKRGMGRSFQQARIFPALDIASHVLLAARMRRSSHIKGLPQMVKDILYQAGLDTQAERQAGLLSYGDRRRLELAMLLAQDPSVLLLDEPLAGLGPAEAVMMISWIRELAKNCAILLIEHDIEAVFALADHVTVMAAGSIIASASPTEICTDPAAQAAYLDYV